jgi:hypothetical protein
MVTRAFRRGALLGLVLLATACSSSTSPTPSQVSVAGTWYGTALLPNAYDASTTLQQTGTSVSGSMRITGVGNSLAFTGTLPAGSQTLSWRFNRDCEVWTGDLLVDSTARHMEGALHYDTSGCVPAKNSGSGTLSLDKQ